MQHKIQVDGLGPQGPAMAEAVEKCVHCGFCLSACPTYKVLAEEMDSPRGRIYLMKEALEGGLEREDVEPFVDRCLGCMACVTACPSGVAYADLLTPFRAQQRGKAGGRSTLERLTHMAIRETLPFNGRFRMAVTAGKLARPFHGLLPDRLGRMLDLLPSSLPTAPPMPDFYPAEGTPRARVALLSGCVQQVLAPEINWATLRVLARNGVEVVIPPQQGCCGSLSLHSGEFDQAQALARNNFKAFPKDVDAVVTNAAGCGSGMREYGLLFMGQPEQDEAVAFADRVKDVSLFLDELGIETPPALPGAMTVAYHDACHLAHAQGVRSEPRSLLATIPNLSLVEIPDGDLCCGSAGTYNLEQPELAAAIGELKAHNIAGTGADLVATGNIGCMTQIQSHLQMMGHDLPVIHTMELLDRAYAAADGGAEKIAATAPGKESTHV